MKKVIAIVLLVALVSAISIGATLAYLTDRDSEVNVFTIGDVTIDLEEEFEQNSTLIPGVKIEKKPTITNTGKNDAWVWLTFAIPAALDVNTPGSDVGSIDNVIHWNFKAATTEGYVTQDKVQKAIDEGFLTDSSLTADKILSENMTWDVMNSIGVGKNVFQQEIDGVLYNVYVMLYNKALKPNETTLPNIEQVYMDANIDIDPNGDWYHVENGIAEKLDWNSNTDGAPKIYVSAYAMQTDGFATVDEAYAAYQKQWTTVDNVNNGLEYIQPTTTAANP
jgi:predicted ribosomally synthesized peptide with SipW-like signal peptide